MTFNVSSSLILFHFIILHIFILILFHLLLYVFSFYFILSPHHVSSPSLFYSLKYFYFIRLLECYIYSYILSLYLHQILHILPLLFFLNKSLALCKLTNFHSVYKTFTGPSQSLPASKCRPFRTTVPLSFNINPNGLLLDSVNVLISRTISPNMA